MSRLNLLGGALVLGLLPVSCSPHQPAPSESASSTPEASYEEAMKANAFIEAAGRGDLEKVREGLAAGIPVDTRYRSFEFGGSGRDDYTALMRASMGGHEAVVRELLAAGANVNAARWNKATALYSATLSDQAAIIPVLKAAGAEGDPVRIRLTQRLILAATRDWNRDRAKHSPHYPGIPRNLHEAEELDAVLAAGADVNDATPAGFTALMYAANLGLVDAVDKLLKCGADVNLRSVFGDTALSLASQYDLKDVVSRLRTAGAK